MKLDTEKKVLLVQKALYTRQLLHYRQLCETYKKLADIAVNKYQLKERPDASIADQIQERYGKYLTMAAQGDLSFVEHNGTTRDGFIAPRFTPEQLKLFKSYSHYSKKVEKFQEASSILQDATYHQDSFDISPELMERFENFMQKDQETASFSKFIAANPKRWIGHISYKRAVSEINKIKEIDPNHLAVLSKSSLTPQSFGATITGARGRITPVKEKITSQFKATYSDKERKEYSKRISLSEELGAYAYRAGYHAKEGVKKFYTAHKGTIQKALKKAAILAVSLSMVVGISKGINAAIDAHEFDTQAHMGNTAYEQTVSDETMQMMQEVDEFLTSLETSSAIPTADQLRKATELVDGEGNIIMDSLIRNSFKDQFSNLTIPEGGVVIQYNKSHDNASDGSLGNYVYITCQDENGKEYKYTIKDFRSQGENRIEKLFSDERNIDNQAKTIGSVYDDNFIANSQSAKKYLADLREMHNHNVKLAGSYIIINNPQITYDNAKATDSETLGDKFKLEMYKLFCIDPTLKTVTPDKVEETKTATAEVETGDTSTSTSEHDHDDR